MEIVPVLKKLSWELIGLVYPPTCCVCETELFYPEKEICTACLSEPMLTNFHLRPQENAAYYRLAGKILLASAGSCFYYLKSGKLKKILHTLKYKHRPGLAYELGQYYGTLLAPARSLFENAHLVPVPLHKSKLRLRGYNQAERFAAGVGKSLNIPLANQCVKRTKPTETQTGKSRSERLANVTGVFQAHKPPTVAILVDDVLTTGATLESLALSLQAAGTEKIHILTLALAK